MNAETQIIPQVRLFDLDALVPDERNARTHGEPQLDQLEGSMRRFGWTIPILVDVERGQLVTAGHGRRIVAYRFKDRGEQIKLPSGGLLPLGLVPGIDCSGWSDDERRAYALADNQLALQAGWDEELLRAELAAISEAQIDLSDLGFDAAALEALETAAINEATGRGGQAGAGRMAAEFLIPPFSVLSAREGWWQDRKRQWLALGLKSEIGRGGNLIGHSLHSLVGLALGDYDKAGPFIDERRERGVPDPEILLEAQGGKNKGALPLRTKGLTFADDILTSRSEIRGDEESKFGRKPGLGGVTMDALSSHPRYYEQKTAAEAKLGRQLTNEEFERDHWQLPDSELSSGTSIFDPVLCEIAYRWFCPPSGRVLDPFAGGSVRGIVAAALGRSYVGVDLRSEQLEANRQQWTEIGPKLPEVIDGAPDRPAPEWLQGDSRGALDDLGEFDFVFSCPPYGDLEVYSDEPADLSNMPVEQFDAAFTEIVAKAVARLKQDRFAVFVVGDYRAKDQRGFYRRFVSKTEAAFEEAGAHLYNEVVLLTSAGSLAIRSGKQFRSTRKVGKTHQNVLVFLKGDPRKAVEALGPVDVSAAMAQFVDEEAADEAADLIDHAIERAGQISSEATEYGERITGIGGEV